MKSGSTYIHGTDPDERDGRASAIWYAISWAEAEKPR
jgi:hypothetical protein